MRVQSKQWRLLAGSAALMLACAPGAQAQEAAEQALTPSVTITHSFVSALRMYKRFYPGLVEFERSKNMAPSADLRFTLVSGSHPLKRLNVSSIMIDQKDFPAVRVPVAADGSFALPLLPEALAANAAVVISRRKGGDFRWVASVHNAGLPDHEYRLGDLRLECRVYIAIQREAAGMFEAKRSFRECERDKLFLNTRPGPALKQIVLTHGGRREVIDLGLHQFDSSPLDLRLPQAADDLAGWPDDARVELLYAQAPQVAAFGTTPDGVKVERVTLENRLGMRLSYIDYGATLVAVEVPDRKGQRANVILSLPDLPAYLASKRRFGTVGRFAGKIAGMRYTLDGKAVNLSEGGKAAAPGFERRIWQRRDFQDAQSAGSVFTLVSPAGDQGFPGTLTVNVTYRLLNDSNEFRIEYAATSDAPTVLNLTNHSYFNLAGAGTAGLRTHRFQIDADRYVAMRDKLPTGTLASVAGTPYDFRQGSDIYQRYAAHGALLGDPPRFDHGLVFSKPLGKFDKVALIEDSASGRRMEVKSDAPSVQFFTGASFDGSETGAEGRAYRPNDGFAFEPQHLSDSPNHPNFPSTALYPGQQFKAVSSYRFSK